MKPKTDRAGKKNIEETWVAVPANPAAQIVATAPADEKYCKSCGSSKPLRESRYGMKELDRIINNLTHAISGYRKKPTAKDEQKARAALQKYTEDRIVAELRMLLSINHEDITGDEIRNRIEEIKAGGDE